MWLSSNLQPSPTEPALPPGISHSQDSGSGGAAHGAGHKSIDIKGTLSRQLDVRILRLLDMPRSYHVRRPKGYVVKAINEDEVEIGRTSEIEGFQGYTPDGLKEASEDIEHVEVGNEGILRLETSARLIFIQVEYSTGELIGRCHIHRLDPRSAKPWPYLLSDTNGNTVNCGIELELSDGVQFSNSPAEPLQSSLQDRMAPVLHPSPSSHSSQHSVGHSVGASNLLASLDVGLPVDPWMPTPIFGQVPNLLDVVRGPPPMQMGSAMAPAGGPAVRSVPVPRSGAYPQAISMPVAPPPLPADYEIWHTPQEIVREYPRGIEYPTRVKEYPTTVVVDSAPRGVPPPPPVVEGDGLQELWCAPPHAGSSDLLFNDDMDLEVKAACSESWNRPLFPHDAPLFEKNMHPERFPDMNVSYARSFEDRHGISRADQQHKVERAREKLPEFSFDWVENNPAAAPPMMMLADAGPGTPGQGAVASQLPLPNGLPTPTVRRAAGKVSVENLLISPDQFRQIEEQCNNAQFVHLDKELVPKEFEVQVVGCIDSNEAAGAEKRVWLRTPGGVNAVARTSVEAWLQEMGTESISVCVTCQKGNRGLLAGRGEALPNQDNFSMTRLTADIAFYVVCDGHGPFGHLVSFRIVQSLPKFVLSELQAPGSSAEQALLKGFEAATLDLATFAKETHLDISSSGASCVAVLRRGPDVQIAWVGDCGALVATLLEDSQLVDMMTRLHTTDCAQEVSRVQQKGAETRAIPPHNVQRIFRPGTNLPGIFVTRAFGDASLEDYGVSWQPDVKKTSFEAVPGLLLLGSGGLWEVASRGEAVLGLLTKVGLHRGGGPQHAALTQLSQLAQKIWQKEEESQCFDDITCLLLHWTVPDAPGARGPSAPLAHRSAAKVMGDTRTKPTTMETPLSQEDVERQCCNPALVQLDPALYHPNILVQVVGCVEAGENFDSEKPVWLRRDGDVQKVEGGSRNWLASFATANIQVGAFCRKGQRFPGSSVPNQDNFSITSASGDRAIYVVCDGHGPLGHLVAFRVAQSLPSLILDGLWQEQNAGTPAEKLSENAMLGAFRATASDLVSFSSEQSLDLYASGTTCAAVLREGDRVHVARLGDTRALIATVVPKSSRLDMMSQAHTPANEIERRRLQDGGLVITQSDPSSALQISRPDVEGLTLTVSRAFGDFKLAGHGVIAVPDVTKTSFTGVPGLVLLASGGTCEFLQDGAPGEELLDVITRQGMLLERGPGNALNTLGQAAQEKWLQYERDYCEDVSGILIQWLAAATDDQAPAAPPRPSQQPSQQYSPYSGSSSLPRAVATPFGQEASSLSAPRVLNAGIGSLPSSQGGLQNFQNSQAVQPRKFLQADPQQGSALTIPGNSAEKPKPRSFLQAQPVSSTKRVQGQQALSAVPAGSAVSPLTAGARPMATSSAALSAAPSSTGAQFEVKLPEGNQSQLGKIPLAAARITANAPSKLAAVPE